MKIWEALIYGLVAGLTGLLPVSFSGHAAVLQDAFALSPLLPESMFLSFPPAT